VRALVLSAAGINLETLVGTFGTVGIEDAWVITNGAGDSIEPDQQPDLVIAVCGPSQPTDLDPAAASESLGSSQFANFDVALRAGRAVGQGYPVFLIVPPPLPRPADLQGVVVAQAPLDNYDALRLHLWAFISTLPGQAHLETPQAAERPTEFNATSVLEQLYAIDEQSGSAALQVERLISALLSQVGAELVENPERDEGRAAVDLAVMPSRSSGDILLVEIKAGRLTEAILDGAERQLQQSVLDRHASLGLVLYHDFAGEHWPSPRTIPLIIRMSVRELVAGLQTNTLPQLITGVARDAARRM
jgi:hypothetical protein